MKTRGTLQNREFRGPWGVRAFSASHTTSPYQSTYEIHDYASTTASGDSRHVVSRSSRIVRIVRRRQWIGDLQHAGRVEHVGLQERLVWASSWQKGRFATRPAVALQLSGCPWLEMCRGSSKRPAAGRVYRVLLT
jgi:hypothetical protein